MKDISKLVFKATVIKTCTHEYFPVKDKKNEKPFLSKHTFKNLTT